jgi:UDP-N-acetylmuramoylalanine--D-glutamate ligase
MAANINAMILDIRKENIKRSLSDWETVGHRQEYVDTIDGIMYYDDSKAENVNATWFTMESLVRPVVWIAGGNDSNTDYNDLKDTVRQNVRAMVCIGKDNSRLKDAFGKAVGDIYEAKSVEEAVNIASLLAKEEDIVLFSPASHSESRRENFEKRGNRFVESVKALGNERH